MGKFILKCFIWLFVAWAGSMVICLSFGITDLNEIAKDKGVWVFGAFIGLMAAYLPKLFNYIK